MRIQRAAFLLTSRSSRKVLFAAINFVGRAPGQIHVKFIRVTGRPERNFSEIHPFTSQKSSSCFPSSLCLFPLLVVTWDVFVQRTIHFYISALSLAEPSYLHARGSRRPKCRGFFIPVIDSYLLFSFCIGAWRTRMSNFNL